jgi:DNA (cytosine-5)-methyltransferase 1
MNNDINENPALSKTSVMVSAGKKKILNLYAGIGGNRMLWGDSYDITAVEYNPNIAKVYSNQFPNDKMVIGDAHQYLLDHYLEFDFIWSSPPCPTHSRMCFSKKTKEYIDFKLYQEIILLQSWFKGSFVVENVIPYYEPLIKPSVILGRHPFWTNFDIKIKEFKNIDISRSIPDDLLNERGINMSIFNCIKDVPENRSKSNRFERMQLVRNMVNPTIGLHILNCFLGNTKEDIIENQMSLFTVS